MIKQTDLRTTSTMPQKRSCTSCYRRKVRCDKEDPCSTCREQSQVCRYPQEPIRRRRARQLPPASFKEAKSGQAEHINVHQPLNHDGRNSNLVVDADGHSRLLSNDFWANVEDDEEYLGKTILEDSQIRTDQKLPSFFNSILHHSRHAGSLEDASNPWTWPSDHIQKCWDLFKQNVDPVVRVLHKPSMETLVRDIDIHGISSLKPESAALMVAICYAAVITLDPSHISQHFNEEYDSIVYKHRYAIDLAMARANWFHSNHIQVMQAIVIVLSCVPREDDRSLWMFTGTALRMATCLGIHCTGATRSKLTPFQIEMRARLWWQLCLIDVRISEDYGAEPTALQIRSSCPLPLNLNDIDWDTSANTTPLQREGFTEMTYSLLRFEAAQKSFESQISPNETEHSFARLEEKANVIASVIKSKYLSLLAEDSMSPIKTLAYQSATLYTVKVRLRMHLSHMRESGLVLSRHHGLFLTSIDLLEKCKQMYSSEDIARFRWTAQQYTQWHAAAFALSYAYKALAEPDYWDRIHDSVSQLLTAVGFLCDTRPSSNDQPLKILKKLYTRTADLYEALESAGTDISLQDMVSTAMPEDMDTLFMSTFLHHSWEDVLEGL